MEDVKEIIILAVLLVITCTILLILSRVKILQKIKENIRSIRTTLRVTQITKQKIKNIIVTAGYTFFVVACLIFFGLTIFCEVFKKPFTKD